MPMLLINGDRRLIHHDEKTKIAVSKKEEPISQELVRSMKWQTTRDMDWILELDHKIKADGSIKKKSS